MKRLLTATAALMMVGAVTFAAWPTESKTVATQMPDTTQTRTEAFTTVQLPTAIPVSATPSPCKTAMPEASPEPRYTEREIEMLAKMVWGEARGCAPEEQRLVIWTALQRADDGRFGSTIESVLTAKNQFAGYREKNPVDPDIYALCAAEATEWAGGTEPPTMEPYAPSTPYLFFDGDGRHNWFREGWER